MSDVIQYDVDVDYYAALGVKPTSSLEEIKAAHVKIALELHPDLQKDKSSHASTSDSFRKISEAWSVLSKPEIKRSYDIARAASVAAQHTAYNYTSSSSGGIQTEIPLGTFNAQQKNYQQTVKAQAGFKVADKYKTEKWQNSRDSVTKYK